MIDKVNGTAKLKVVQPFNELNSASNSHYLSVFF